MGFRARTRCNISIQEMVLDRLGMPGMVGTEVLVVEIYDSIDYKSLTCIYSLLCRIESDKWP